MYKESSQNWEHPKKRFSESAKRKIVAEYEEGFMSIAELKRKYYIRSNSSLQVWLNKYGRLNYKTNLSVGRPNKDPLLQRIKELEKALEKKEMEVKAVNMFMEIAERELGITIKKSPASSNPINRDSYRVKHT